MAENIQHVANMIVASKDICRLIEKLEMIKTIWSGWHQR